MLYVLQLCKLYPGSSAYVPQLCKLYPGSNVVRVTVV